MRSGGWWKWPVGFSHCHLGAKRATLMRSCHYPPKRRNRLWRRPRDTPECRKGSPVTLHACVTCSTLQKRRNEVNATTKWYASDSLHVSRYADKHCSSWPHRTLQVYIRSRGMTRTMIIPADHSHRRYRPYTYTHTHTHTHTHYVKDEKYIEWLLY